jgi:glycerol-3-phosphate cytidylyltransferase|tara:strand:- start:14 stop:445 length:432 start_codon:yes stop_codon:yes gene_type:complete
MKKAIVLGTFDLTHYGHYRMFKRLREMGFKTVAGVTTDEFAESYKRKPILNLNERIENLASCKYVDEVIINVGGHNSKEDILFSGATHIVHGSDWTGESMYKQIGIDEKWLEDKGIEVMYLPYTRGVSTSEILEKVKNEFSKK